MTIIKFFLGKVYITIHILKQKKIGKMEAEEAEQSNPDSMKVESTSMNRPMPFSEGW